MAKLGDGGEYSPTPPDKVEQAFADKWYVVDVNGIVTLCASKEDAEREAAENAIAYPRNAPYIIARTFAFAAPATINHDEIDRKLIDGGTITGWRMASGVRVFTAKPFSPHAEDQEFVRYTDYAALEAEYEEVSSLLTDARYGIGVLTVRAETAEAALAEARRDAERFRGYEEAAGRFAIQKAELRRAGQRVIDAFTAHGKAGGLVDNAKTRAECEAAMVALAEVLQGEGHE